MSFVKNALCLLGLSVLATSRRVEIPSINKALESKFPDDPRGNIGQKDNLLGAKSLAQMNQSTSKVAGDLCVCTMNDESSLPGMEAQISRSCGGYPVVLAVQDCRSCGNVGDSIPRTSYVLEAKLDGLQGKGPSTTHTCEGKVKDKDSHCGIPALLTAGLRMVGSSKSVYSDMTGTTEKGTVWATFEVSDKKKVIVATSHGAEGIRCKNGKTGDGTDCEKAAFAFAESQKRDMTPFDSAQVCEKGTMPNASGAGKFTAYYAEMQRVKHFSNVVEILSQPGPPVVWGMDMNTRRVDENHCPVFGTQGAISAKYVRFTNDPESGSLDYLGAGRLVHSVMEPHFEWHPSQCPTYQKSSKGADLAGCGAYDAVKKPVSFVDRIYTKNVAEIVRVQNVKRENDHDIVCAVVKL